MFLARANAFLDPCNLLQAIVDLLEQKIEKKTHSVSSWHDLVSRFNFWDHKIKGIREWLLEYVTG